MRAWALDARGLHQNYPELSMAEIHSALAYYYENQDALDRAIAKDAEASALLEVEVSDSQLRSELVERKFGRRDA